MSIPFRIYPIRREEVLRRSAMLNPSPEEIRLYEECARDAEYVLNYHITERNRPMEFLDGDEAMREKMAGCDSIIVFTAVLGDAFRELAEGHDEPEKDILYQGLAAERMDALIESYLDHKEKILAEAGAVLTRQFPYRWKELPEDAFTATRIVGVSYHPELLEESRCRSCFAENCYLRVEEAEKPSP